MTTTLTEEKIHSLIEIKASMLETALLKLSMATEFEIEKVTYASDGNWKVSIAYQKDGTEERALRSLLDMLCDCARIALPSLQA